MSLTIKCETRDIFGKNASRRLRREGKVPAVLYGGNEPSKHLTLQKKDIFGILRSESGENTIFKAAIDKERPNGDDNNAFPSGHTATAFAGAAFLHRRYGWSDAWPAYALAAYTGWTRVHTDEHDTWDVLGGAALAVGWNWWLVKPRQAVQVQPLAEAGYLGLRISGDW